MEKALACNIKDPRLYYELDLLYEEADAPPGKRLQNVLLLSGGERGRLRYVCMDLGHSAENVYLQCISLGLGTCGIGAFHDDAVRLAVRLPREEEPLYIMPVGVGLGPIACLFVGLLGASTATLISGGFSRTAAKRRPSRSHCSPASSRCFQRSWPTV
jgi:hypothetical protein